MKSISAAEMQTLDRRATEEFGVPSILLMENAGRGVAEYIIHHFQEKRVAIVVGKGKNGGDGLVIARLLHNYGYLVNIILLVEPSNFKGDVLLNYEIVLQKGVPLEKGYKSPKKIPTYLAEANLIVDAILGIGIRDQVDEIFASTITAMNQSGRPILSVDIPSGLDADSGEIHGVAIKANVTATMGIPKHGLYKEAGKELSGEIVVIDIGLPKALLE
jgi:ADP-dependent NAD(P)H-hydrate dehydratase / NAD(P)H-hydrate epimerase